MSAVSEAARVNLVVADVAQPDPHTGKANMLGAGITILGWDGGQGATAPFHVFAEIFIPQDLAPVDAGLELWLEDESGDIVNVPGPTGSQPIRIGQQVSFEVPRVQGLQLPDNMPSRVQYVVGFQNGLPLAPGRGYEWVLRLDLDNDHVRRYVVTVPGASPGPVLG